MKAEPTRCCSQAGQRAPVNWFAAGEEVGEDEEPVEGGAVVGGREADEGVDLGRAAEELEVVARHHPALRVADQVDLGGAGRGEDFVDEGVQFARPSCGMSPTP